MDLNKIIHLISIGTLPILLCITLREVARGWIALQFGDTTARDAGRLTFNPIAHIDWIGTVLVPLLCMVIFQIPFGWIRSMPIDYRNLRDPRKDMVWVCLTGPFMTLVMAVFWVWVAKIGNAGLAGSYGAAMQEMGIFGMYLNLGLTFICLLPIPPMDGGRILISVLPQRAAMQLARVEPWGFWIVIALIFTGLLNPLYRLGTWIFQLLFV